MDYTFKGTPGPWVAKMSHSDVPSEDGINGEFQSMSGYVKSGSSSVANVLGIKGTMSNSGWVPYEDAEYNANLISAAPDLLQVAINALNDMRTMVPKSAARDARIFQIENVLNKALNLQP